MHERSLNPNDLDLHIRYVHIDEKVLSNMHFVEIVGRSWFKS